MPSLPTIRVLHPGRTAAGWGIAGGATALLLAVAAFSLPAHADPCALTALRHSAPLDYPPIARAAHVAGDVTLTANFAPDGSTTTVTADQGPVMLRQAAIDYVKSWRVNENSAGQLCPVLISFRLADNGDCTGGPSVFIMADLQHMVITGHPVPICDPAAELRTRHHFLFIHWYTKS